MRILGKGSINRALLPHLSIKKKGYIYKEVGMWRVIEATIYKLKTGVQWRKLPMKEFFPRRKISWQSVFYYYNEWCKDGSWANLWHKIMSKYKHLLDLSSVDMDGSHTAAKNGGEAVGYQSRKKAKTTNMLFLTDRKGIVVGCGEPVSGNHHDVFEIKKVMSKIVSDLKAIGLCTEGLFLNADAGFDCKLLRQICSEHDILPNVDANKGNARTEEELPYVFDSELYKERYSIERTNAWIDAFKQLIIRYEKKAQNWLSFHYLAFTLLFLRNRKILNLNL